MNAAGRLALIVLALAVFSDTAGAETPDSLVTRLKRLLAACDSQIHDMTYLSTVHERELRDDGSAKSEKVYRTRHYVRGEDYLEVLEAMWEDGEPVAASKLADEQRKRDKERAKRRKEHVDKKSDDEPGSHSQEMLAPLKPEHIANYRFPAVVEEEVGGVACWRLSVEPVRDDEDLVRGSIWVARAGGHPVAEEYELAKRPGPLKEFRIRIDLQPIAADCVVPRRVHLKGRGKALLLFKFSFDVEVLLDSVVVNPGLPDSIFAVPVSR